MIGARLGLRVQLSTEALTRAFADDLERFAGKTGTVCSVQINEDGSKWVRVAFYDYQTKRGKGPRFVVGPLPPSDLEPLR
jgi:hypothetical protein